MKESLLIKIGGSLAVDLEKLSAFAKTLGRLVKEGYPLAVVHGGGKEINENLELLKEKPVFVNGLRVTDGNVLNMVEMTLSAQVNKKLVRLLQKEGVAAVGISGVDGALISAVKKESDVDLGYVGSPHQVRPELVHTLWQGGFLPVISPISTSVEAQAFNVNADHAASAIANALKVDRLIFVSDVPGVLNEGEVVPHLNEEEIEKLIESKVIQGGMIPKVQSCLESLHCGIQEIHIAGWESGEQFYHQLSGVKNSGTIISK